MESTTTLVSCTASSLVLAAVVVRLNVNFNCSVSVVQSFFDYEITRVVFQVNSLDVVLHNPKLSSSPVGYSLDGRLIFEGTPSSIPEPATIYLMLIGFASVAGTARHRRPPLVA
ncbi:PEP-CTERM sorting domain-containing protein [Candidatus Accumulibacter phosphatis]|uniref:PEP-CTERM sorting domain-containing protein n=1 Tax=Candidatus Accumulibacter contiguus TaxID=2954381 RepID=A0ABX1T3M1_9PROT|nr:PEP-CTERM sorting domain-containing protein [Candidatus Accumulibacter contiguus]